MIATPEQAAQALQEAVHDKYGPPAAPEPKPRPSFRTPPPKKWACKVVGVTFAPGYPDNVLLIRDGWDALVEMGVYDGEAPSMAAHLVRAPDNPHDANAIEVHAAECHLGHVPAQVAAKIAPRMDEGAEYQAYLTRVMIHPDHLDRPGIRLAAKLKEPEQ